MFHLFSDPNAKNLTRAFSEFNQNLNQNLRLIKRLPEAGAFSSIYLVKNENNHDLILKTVDTLHVNLALSASSVCDYIEREIGAMEALRGCPHIMPLISSYRYPIDVAKKHYIYFLLMPKMVDSLSYFKQCDFDASSILAMAKDICKALGICHQKGIHHRDIKPQNIFFCEAEQSFYLSDFGSSRLWNVPRRSTLLGSSLNRNDFFFVAPEILKQQDLKGYFNSDIYSLGKTMIALLMRYSPVLTTESAKQKIDVLPKREGAIMKKALAEVPAERFLTADEFFCALETIKDPEKLLYSSGEALLPECVDAFTAGDYSVALQKAKAGYELKNPTLTCIYAYILHCMKDSERALEVLRPLRKSNPCALGLHGIIMGALAERNHDDMMKELSNKDLMVAAALKFAPAQYYIGRWKFDGQRGFEKNMEQGLDLLFSSARLGFRPAFVYLHKAISKSDLITDKASMLALIEEELALTAFNKDQYADELFLLIASQSSESN